MIEFNLHFSVPKYHKYVATKVALDALNTKHRNES